MNQVELKRVGTLYTEAEPDEAEIRVDEKTWQAYRQAMTILNATEAEIERIAIRPIFVTPDQEESMRSVVRDDAWIVVRDSPPSPSEAQDVRAAPAPHEDVPVVPRRPREGPCDARSGLPHAPSTYVLCDAESVYYPGLKRVDGVCQCGKRLEDIPCPHRKQELDSFSKQPKCAICGKQLLKGTGFHDNRLPDGAADPRYQQEIAPGVRNKDEVPVEAFRV